MGCTQTLTLGLVLQAPRALKDQRLTTSVSPHRLELFVEAERGSLYPCPECGTPVRLTTLLTRLGDT